MPLTFTLDLPPGYPDVPCLISGDESVLYPNKIYLLHSENEELIDVYEIRYEYHISPFKQTLIVDNVLAVGYEKHFYLFDIFQREVLLLIHMKGYFGHLYFSQTDFYVTDAECVYRLDKTGKIIWQTDNLGHDGVIIEEMDALSIVGSGEWDPPGGWLKFMLDKTTGLVLKDEY